MSCGCRGELKFVDVKLKGIERFRDWLLVTDGGLWVRFDCIYFRLGGVGGGDSTGGSRSILYSDRQVGLL